MPELPEVEVVRQQLADKITGKEIANVTVRCWKSVKNDRYFQKALTGQEINQIDRKGKYLFFTLSQEESYLICHLKMTGRLIFLPAADDTQYGGGHAIHEGLKEQPHEHTRIIFTFTDQSQLYFNDMRKFGYMQRADATAVEAQRNSLGPEPLTADYTADLLASVLDGRSTSVKAALLDQSRIAGLGNIYVDEACWRAGVYPDREAGSLSKQEIQHLYDATQSVLTDSLSFGGTTLEDFADTNGEHGNFTDRLAVFGKDGTACPRCGSQIIKLRVAGRGTHVCPKCQK